jgi:hypothetical protein
VNLRILVRRADRRGILLLHSGAWNPTQVSGSQVRYRQSAPPCRSGSTSLIARAPVTPQITTASLTNGSYLWVDRTRILDSEVHTELLMSFAAGRQSKQDLDDAHVELLRRKTPYSGIWGPEEFRAKKQQRGSWGSKRPFEWSKSRVRR